MIDSRLLLNFSSRAHKASSIRHNLMGNIIHLFFLMLEDPHTISLSPDVIQSSCKSQLIQSMKQRISFSILPKSSHGIALQDFYKHFICLQFASICEEKGQQKNGCSWLSGPVSHRAHLLSSTRPQFRTLFKLESLPHTAIHWMMAQLGIWCLRMTIGLCIFIWLGTGVILRRDIAYLYLKSFLKNNTRGLFSAMVFVEVQISICTGTL